MTITAVSTNDAALRNFKFQIRDASSCDGDGYRPGRPSPTECEEKGRRWNSCWTKSGPTLGWLGPTSGRAVLAKGARSATRRIYSLQDPPLKGCHPSWRRHRS